MYSIPEHRRTKIIFCSSKELPILQTVTVTLLGGFLSCSRMGWIVAQTLRTFEGKDLSVCEREEGGHCHLCVYNNE
jgi:hypothetical protein